jgi:hypothetical protein
MWAPEHRKSAPRLQNKNADTIDRTALDRVPVFDQDYITTMSRFSTTVPPAQTGSHWW